MTALDVLKRLDDNLQRETLSAGEQETLLAQTKIFSRQPEVVRQQFAPESIVTLSTYGLRRTHSIEALRCLANALFLVESHRQVFVDNGFAVDSAELLKSCDYDHEFLLCRLLFLLTYNTNLSFDQLDDRCDLAGSITRLLQRHVDRVTDDKANTTPSHVQALDETLRLLFNVTHFFPSLSKRFETAVRPVVLLLLRCPVPTPPLQPPIACLINALLNVDIKAAAKSLQETEAKEGNTDVLRQASGHSKDQTQAGSITAVVDRLVDILDHAVREHAIATLDTLANPLCTLLRRICEAGDDHLRKNMGRTLLPQAIDRKIPLGEGDTLAAHLLRLSIAADLPHLGKNISSLLFELSNSDPEQYVHNVGYGYASGHLMNIGMTVPVPSSTSPSEDTPSVNPVTGQSLDKGVSDNSLSEMTDEEKEREAERLFVLFERLKATGVVDVKNPVERLYNDG